MLVESLGLTSLTGASPAQEARTRYPDCQIPLSVPVNMRLSKTASGHGLQVGQHFKDT